MKIAVISTPVFICPPSGYSGLEFLAWQIAKGLAAKGHEVSLAAPEDSTCPGCKIIGKGKAGTWDEKSFYGSYWKDLLEVDCTIDHSWAKYPYMLKMEGVLKTPVLGVCHAPVNTMFQSLPNVPRPCFVCISDDQRAHFEAMFSNEARTCHNGIDLNHYQPLNVPRSDRFLFLARFSTIKGPDLAIEACLRAGAGLDLIGDTSITNEPEFLESCKKMAEQSSPGWDQRKGKQIRLIGSVTRGETVWWYSQAHMLLHPNQRFREPLGLAPLEAMACFCPVIAFNYGAMRETVGKEGGVLVKSLDEMVATMCGWWKPCGSDMSGAREMAREKAMQFSEEAMVSRYEQLCMEAVESGGW